MPQLTRLSIAASLTLIAMSAHALDVGGAATDAMKEQAINSAVDTGADMAKEQAMGAMGMDKSDEAEAEAEAPEEAAAEATEAE